MKDDAQNINFLDHLNENLDDLKDKIYDLLNRLDSFGIDQVEAKIATLMQNLMNFFSQFVSEIPSFDSLTDEKKELVSENFKICSHTIIKKKVTNIEELMNIFLYHIFYNIGLDQQKIGGVNLQEVIKNKKIQDQFNDYIKRSLAFECFKMINPNFTLNESKEDKFIDNAVVYGVKNALKLAGITKLDSVDIKAVSLLEHAHLKFKSHNKEKFR